MTTNAIRHLHDDAAARKVTIAHALLSNASDGLERLDRLLQAGELDRRAMQKELSEALHLVLIVVEELDDIEQGRLGAA